MTSPNRDLPSTLLENTEQQGVITRGDFSHIHPQNLYNANVNHQRQSYEHDPTRRNVQIMQNFVADRGGTYAFIGPSDIYTYQQIQSGENFSAYSNTPGYDLSSPMEPPHLAQSSTTETGLQDSFYMNNMEGIGDSYPNPDYSEVPTNPKHISRSDYGDNNEFLNASDGQVTISYDKQTGRPRAIWKNKGGYIPIFDTSVGDYIQMHNSDGGLVQGHIENKDSATYDSNTGITTVFNSKQETTFSDSYQESLKAYRKERTIYTLNKLKSNEGQKKLLNPYDTVLGADFTRSLSEISTDFISSSEYILFGQENSQRDHGNDKGLPNTPHNDLNINTTAVLSSRMELSEQQQQENRERKYLRKEGIHHSQKFKFGDKYSTVSELLKSGLSAKKIMELNEQQQQEDQEDQENREKMYLRKKGIHHSQKFKFGDKRYTVSELLKSGLSAKKIMELNEQQQQEDQEDQEKMYLRKEGIHHSQKLKFGDKYFTVSELLKSGLSAKKIMELNEQQKMAFNYE